MTTPPVVLVDVYSSERHFIPLPQDIRAHVASAIQTKTQAIRQPSVSTSSPPEAQLQYLSGANLRQRVYLAPTPPHGAVCYPIAKASHLDQQTGTKSPILCTSWS